MCHCERNMCDAGGVCRAGTRCQKGWFGPSCQYRNLLNMDITVIEPSTVATDDEEDTCTFVQNLKIYWKSAKFEISWIRLIVRDKVKTAEAEVRLNGSATKCPDQTVSHYDRRTIDVYCNASSLVDTIHIHVSGLNVCSVYISGGRNVALKQATSESSRPSNSKLAVDGNKDGNYYRNSCTHSDSTQANPFWEVRLASPHAINRFVVYNRNDCCGTRLSRFKLSAHWDNNTTVYTHTNNDGNRNVYYMTRVSTWPPISFVRITVPGILTLCEVQLYGDSVCAAGYFGLDCTGRCTCDTDQECFVATGGCRSGCASGFQGQGCSEECHPGTWGIDCLQTCSTRCKNQDCHRSNGTCLDGCVAGYMGLTCSEECRPDRFGPGCIFSCSTNCTDSRCNSVTGFCLLCKPGKTGAFCDQECGDGFYGQNCSNNCSTLCENRLCHPVSGGCYRCVQGLPCVLESVEETLSTAAIVPVVILLIVLLVLVVFIIVWKRRRGSINRKHIHEYNTVYNANSDVELADTERAEKESKELHDVNKHAYTNVADDIENTAIEIKHLIGYLQDHDSTFLKEQFERIPQPAGVSMLVGLDERNIKKNRYKNICAYDHSRVHLNVNTDLQESDYINASYVQGYGGKEKFIAAQGPTSVTVNDFVRMLWEQRVDTVVMLTNLTEEGKIKCEQYWPHDGAVEFNGIEVSLAVTRVFADYTIRKLELKKRDSPSHTLTHYHYTSWPDKGVPTTPWSLVDFEQRVAACVTSVPIAVHCSAGVGRTGTFIALRNLMREAEVTGRFDFFQTVLKLRQDRVLLVQTAEQYEFLHKAGLVASVCVGRTISSTCITERLATLEKRNLTGITGMEAEFESVCEVVTQLSNKSTNDENNVYANNFVSNNNLGHTLQLVPESPELGEQVKAVLVPSFTKPNDQILNYTPDESTVIDFWRLVAQYNVSLVVVAEGKRSQSVATEEYLPTNLNEAMDFGPYEIKSLDVQRSKLWEDIQISLKSKMKNSVLSKLKQSSGATTVTFIKSTSLDLNDKNILKFVKHIRSSNSRKQGKVLYMCKDGVTLSSLTCVLCLLLDRMDTDQCLTVPLVVGAMKSVSPSFIPTLDQYVCLYRVLHRYIETNPNYNNFSFKISVEADHIEGGIVQEDENIYANTT